MTSLSEGLKVEESQMIGMESIFFYGGLKPEFANIIGTKSGINPRLKTNFLPNDSTPKTFDSKQKF